MFTRSPLQVSQTLTATGTETLGDGYPSIRAGTGERTLLVFPGFGDAMHPGIYPPVMGPAFACYMAEYLDSHTVYLVSRPRGLPQADTAADAAERHAAMIESEGFEAVDVIGISMGGLIGLELASTHPALVERLVLANSGARIDPEAQPAVEQLYEYAIQGQ